MSRATDTENDDIPFGRPCIGAEEEQAVLRVLRSGWLTTGRECSSFEAEFAEMVGVPHAVAVSSATAGLHLALEAFGIGPGDRVVTTPLTFAATGEVICALGAEPVFADIDPQTGNICPAAAAEAIARSKAKALIPVHMGGLTCDMEGLRAAAAKHGCIIIEDAAHSLPACTSEGYAGALADAGVYSFYANKNITTGEGGMIVTGSADAAARMRLMRNHGIDREVWQRYTATRASWRYDITAAGFKYNMPDLAAAIGRVQLRKVHHLNAIRRTIADRYRRGFADSSFLQLPPEAADHSYHLFQIRIIPDTLKIDRDRFIMELQERGIGVSVHFIPLHTMSYYRQRFGYSPEDYPAAMNWFERCISLPIYPDLKESQVERIITAVNIIGSTFRAEQEAPFWV